MKSIGNIGLIIPQFKKTSIFSDDKFFSFLLLFAIALFLFLLPLLFGQQFFRDGKTLKSLRTRVWSTDNAII